jgi:hypothetical protein
MSLGITRSQVTTPSIGNSWLSLAGTYLGETQVIPFSGPIAGVPDTGISRLGAASLAIGNGTAGDYSGSIKLKSVLVTDVAANTDWTLQNTTAATATSTPAIVASGVATSGSEGSATPTLNTTNATLLVAVLCGYQGATTISDSLGNTWNLATSSNVNDGNTYISVYYAYSNGGGALSTSSSDKFTLSGSSTFGIGFIYALSGTLTTAAVFDVAQSNASLSPGSVTPTVGDFIISGCDGVSGFGGAALAGFTNGLSQSGGLGGASAVVLGSTGSPYNVTWTTSGGAANASTIACFKSALTYLNQASPIMKLAGTVYDATAAGSIADYWTIQDVVASAVEDGSSTLTLAHSGSTGLASIQIPNLNNQGGYIGHVNTQSGATYTPLATDYVVIFTYAGAVAVTLNSALATGTTFRIKNKAGVGNSVTLTPSSGTIDGSATFVMSTNYQSVDVVFDGTNWNAF